MQAHDTFSGYWDASPEFLKKINELLGLNRRNKITVIAPFEKYKKCDIVKRGIELGVDFSKTWTCYNGRKKACGTCPTCADRIQAFMENKVIDPVEYEVEIPWKEHQCVEYLVQPKK
jgi:7-cyano-7-deazaguanine synthase